MRMKNRWIGGLLLVAALTLAACRAPDQGGQSSEEPSQATESAAPASTEPSMGGSESAEPTPDDYEY